MLRTVLATMALLLIASPVLAGTASNPELVDDATDSQIFAGTVVPQLEVTKAWIQPRGDRFHFIMEVAALDEVPRDAVYVFHYSFGGLRLFYRAQWAEDGSEVEFFGGTYQGYQGTYAFDPQGNRQYLYIRGSDNQTERLDGSIKPGAPGRIEWSYPMDSFGDDRRGLTFKGLFVTTYQKRPSADDASRDGLQYIDTAITEEDYVHRLYSPWWSKFVPGPSPLLVLATVGALAAIGARRRAA